MHAGGQVRHATLLKSRKPHLNLSEILAPERLPVIAKGRLLAKVIDGVAEVMRQKQIAGLPIV